MSQVAEVALNLPLYRNFDYLIPPQQTVSKGCRVEVQFGRQRLVGIVVNVKSDSEFLDKLKPISDVIDEQPVISSHLVSLVEFASQYYQKPIGECYQVALPNLINKGEALDKAAIPIIKLIDSDANVTGKKQQQLLTHLKESGSTPITELTGLGFISSTINSLLKKGIIEKTVEYNRNWQTNPLSVSDKPRLNKEQAIALASINQHSQIHQLFIRRHYWQR